MDPRKRTLKGRHHVYGTCDRVVFRDHLSSSASPPRRELVPASRCWCEARALVQPEGTSVHGKDSLAVPRPQSGSA